MFWKRSRWCCCGRRWNCSNSCWWRCMKNDTFVTRLARGAVASTIAGAWLVPQGHSADAIPAHVSGAAATAEQAAGPEKGSREEAAGAYVLTISEFPKEWTKTMEKEFRRL